jgi:chemotaxis protein methyltransferase CheR
VNQTVLSQSDYDAFQAYLETACGIVLGNNKHYLVTSRLNRLTDEFTFPSLSELLANLQRGNDKRLRESVINAMTTNETSWFRDTYPFEMLKKSIFPELVKQKPNPLRIWSAASSTGQESYSISMTTSEYQLTNPGAMPGRVEIVGTDISSRVVKSAREGKYDELSMARGLSEERKKRYFIDNKDGGWTINKDIGARTRFTELNLLTNYTLMGRFDIIFCRNVLIYFSSEMKTDILQRMAAILNPGGFLFLGGSESPTGYCNNFEMMRMPEGVVYRLRQSPDAHAKLFPSR